MQDIPWQKKNVRGRGETHLHELVPAGRDNDRVLGVGAEADARDPVGVALIGDGVLAVTESVPELDGLVPRAGHDLAVVGGERDGKDVVVVADKAAGGGAGGELPEAERLVPRGGQGVGTVGRDDLGRVSKSSQMERYTGCQMTGWDTYTVGDDVGVALESPLGVTVLGLVAGEVPDDQGVVTATGEEHVGAGKTS